MAIVRIDLEEVSDDVGWSWKDVQGYDEQITVSSKDTLEFSSEATGRSYEIALEEIPKWIKALTEAQKYFDNLENK